MPKRGSIWGHFKQSDGAKKVKCKYCGAAISISGGSLGNLRRHMKSKHPFTALENDDEEDIAMVDLMSEPDKGGQQLRAEKSPFKQPKMTAYAKKPPNKKKLDEIDGQLLKMIAKGHHALRNVEEPDFRKLIEIVSQCPGYKLPTRQKLSKKLIPETCEELRINMKESIQAVEAVCPTTDAWTSRNNAHYVAVTAHYVNSDNAMSSSLLCCKDFNDRHTSENLRNFLKDVVCEWGIANKISAVVSDNAPNIVGAITQGGWRSVGCFARCLNLLVQKATPEISDIKDKVKSIVEFFRRNAPALRKLEQMEEQLNFPNLKLKQDVVTRWNSTYEMLERFIKLKDAITAVVAIMRPKLIVDQSSWEVIEGVLPLLKPFYEITIEISAEKCVTLSKVIVCRNLINNFLSKFSSENRKVMDLPKCLKQGMQIRFDRLEYNELYAECTFLDPRFKQQGFQNENAFEYTKNELSRKILNEDILAQRIVIEDDGAIEED
ncbi:E3 SUMO-protein ligase ZBED1-like [Eurosta solidaginis]|uniref:E3 SUMO-protein ligase ZBED1-like n=1 Tax=Eurosta solidaginis TaxID=178769 RepID=UPI0035307E6E